METDQDQEQFFKDLGATVEQTVEEVRGVEENFFSVIQKTTFGLPWIVELNDKFHSYAEQYNAAALKFAHELSQAKDFQDFARIQTEFVLKQLNAFTQAASDARKTPLKDRVSSL